MRAGLKRGGLERLLRALQLGHPLTKRAISSLGTLLTQLAFTFHGEKRQTHQE
jgi:hypothetical protein